MNDLDFAAGLIEYEWHISRFVCNANINKGWPRHSTWYGGGLLQICWN